MDGPVKAKKHQKTVYLNPLNNMELAEDKVDTVSLPRYTYSKEELIYLIDALTQIYDEYIMRTTH